MKLIAQNLHFLREKVAAAATAAGRRPQDICIIAAAKTFSADDIRAAAAAGAADIGENYVQEGIGKMAELAELSLAWHFIGRLQKNKSKDAARRFDWVHTVDGEALARRLAAAREGMPPLNICLQINIDGESSKNGIAPEEAANLARAAAALPNLRLRGLMAIPRPAPDICRSFRALAALRDSIARECGLSLDTLSMGMSGDFAEAITEGATHIRIGRAVFGARERKV